MAEWWRNQFNGWFGSNITFVANAYESADFVWLLFHNDKLSLNKLSLQGTPRDFKVVNISADMEMRKVTEKVRIPFGDFHKKQRTTAHEYITIMAKKTVGTDTIICENYEIGANRSFIITCNAAIKQQKYGANNLWLDEFGVNHNPRQ